MSHPHGVERTSVAPTRPPSEDEGRVRSSGEGYGVLRPT